MQLINNEVKHRELLKYCDTKRECFLSDKKRKTDSNPQPTVPIF